MHPRALRAVGPAILVVAAVSALVVAVWFGGAAAPLSIGDPGPFVRWGVPVAKLFVNLSGAVMAGSIVLALFALRAGEREFDAALDVSSIGAAVFTVASGATGFLTFLDVFNPQLSAGPQFGAQLGRFLVEQELGRAWLITTIAGALVTVLAFAVRSFGTTLITGILALVALIPVATQGHSGELSGHDLAVTSLSLHVLGAAVWVGGLVLVVALRPILGDRLTTVLLRYSSVALVAFIVVAVSGFARSLLSIQAWEQLLTPYGAILVTKIVALLAMGVLGAWYRRRLIGRLDERGGARRFWGLVAMELALMGIASGAAAALARTPPPAGETVPALRTPAELLTDSPLPPEFTLVRWLTEWRIDLLWLLVAAFGIAFYLLGVWRLRRRGDNWPVFRTVMWVLGMLMLLWVTGGPINAYQEYLFSVHMLGHMLLTMAIPLLLVPGAPVTLAARTLARRDDGSRGGREWILWAVHSPVARILTNPFVAAALFIGSLWVFYYTELFRWMLYDHLGHLWMVAHFLLIGYLFGLSLVGIDPVAWRLPYPGRLITLIALMAMHAFFGISIMMHSGLMAAEWYGSMGRTWGPTPLEDQYAAGGVAWSIGEIPTLILAITLAIQWSTSDERVQRRRDRHADRTGDSELEEYNARLAALADRDAARGL